MIENRQDRKGDKIFIEGSYQFNAYYSGRAPQRFWHFAKLLEAQKELAVRAGDKILDAGCGSGLLASFLAKEPSAEIWGIDANPSAIDFCLSKYASENLHFIQALLDGLPFENQSFHKIVLLEVIEHLSPAQADKILRNFYKLLIPGGSLVISTPNKNSLWPLTEFLLDSFRLVPTLAKEQHEYLYSGHQLRTKAEQVGFQCVSHKTINFIAPWLAAINWKLALRIHTAEQNIRSRLGSLLLYTFSKPENQIGELNAGSGN